VKVKAVQTITKCLNRVIGSPIAVQAVTVVQVVQVVQVVTVA